ncbi:MAG: YdcH family protein [Burkholderiaceae bacterium]|nr:YdcH family protein [Burkholderiaceae bacterium]
MLGGTGINGESVQRIQGISSCSQRLDNGQYSKFIQTLVLKVKKSVFNSKEIYHRLTELEREHREVDQAIELLMACPPFDELKVKRMKKHKLLLKDQIAFLKYQLTPDIPA